MASELTTARPRVDRQFVDAQGKLTQSAYALLDKIVNRTGGIDGISAEELRETIQSVIAESISGAPAIQENARAVEELRNELASARNDNQTLRAGMEEVWAVLEGLRPVSDLRVRVETIEGRLQ
jgi:hypothetical protein